MVRTGHGAELYDYTATEKLQNKLVGPANGALPFDHLAYEALLYVPFSFLGYRSAYAVFLFTNLVVLVTCTRMLWAYFSPLGDLWSLLPGAIVLCFLPVVIALIEGQDSLILLSLIVASLFAMDRQKESLAGIFLGLTLFKFQYALPIAFLYLVWRRWRFLAGFAASGLTVAGVSLWLTGLPGMEKYLSYLLSMSARFSAANGTLYGVHPEGMPNLRGLVYVVSGGSVSSAHLVTFGLSGLVLIWAGLKRPSLPGALLAAMLVSYHQTIADTSLLVLPLGLVLAGWITEPTARRPRLAALACVVFIGPALLLFVGVRFYLLTIPLLGLFALWDGTYLSQKGGGQGISRPQKETNCPPPPAAGPYLAVSK